MAGLPTPPTRATSFTAISTNTPTAQLPGDKVDAELDRTNKAVSQLITFVSTLFAPGGTLKPNSVPPSALSTDLAATLAQLDVAAQTLADQRALQWAEYLAGPIVNTDDAAAYIAGSPFPAGLYGDAVQGQSGGMFSAKYWALQAQQLVSTFSQARLAGLQIVGVGPFAPDNTNVAFPLRRLDDGDTVSPASAAELLLFINGFAQTPGTDYQVAGSTLVLLQPPTADSSMSAVWLTSSNPTLQGLPDAIDGGTFPAADDAGPSDLALDGGFF